MASEKLQWQPSAALAQLRQRAVLLQQVRQFFLARDVLEVETPLLAQAAVTEVHTPAFSVHGRYLQTSPEYAMKRLLAAGSGPIYQICKAFRDESAGSWHNPEFTMLEWYRPDFDWRQLADEVIALLSQLLVVDSSEYLSYQQLFEHYLGINPHNCDLTTLRGLTRQHLGDDPLATDNGDGLVNSYLDLLLSHVIEPKLTQPGRLIVLYDYPASQAALAKIENRQDGVAVGQRFEVFYQGVELANGYFELQDAREQRQRFESDLSRRRQLALPEVPIDGRFMAALESGLPRCSGVAVGLDRLLMLQQGKQRLSEVLSFPWHLA